MKVSNRDKLLAIFLAFYVALLPACGNNNPASADKTPPQIPPQATMQMNPSDLKFFRNGTNPAADELAVLSKQNWTTAAVVVTLFNAAVLVAMAIPVAATGAALQEKPTFEDDGKFHWRFTFSEGGPSYDFELVAEVKATVIDWQMFVTSSARGFEKFLWYDGQSNLGGGAGHWQFYDDAQPTTPTNVARIDWQYASDNDASLQFLNNKSGAPGFGDTLGYTVLNDSVSVDFQGASNGKDTTISWNRQTREGYIIASDYKNGQKSCWDSNLDDVACTN